MRLNLLTLFATAGLLITAAWAAQTPTELQEPGTQPGEVRPVINSAQCSACHSNINPLCFFCHPSMEEDSEPWSNWQGSMMGHASRAAGKPA